MGLWKAEKVTHTDTQTHLYPTTTLIQNKTEQKNLDHSTSQITEFLAKMLSYLLMLSYLYKSQIINSNSEKLSAEKVSK